MTTDCKVTKLFCIIDEFCKHFDAENAGGTLGLSGNSRMSTDPHLHLTTKKDGKVFDPVILLKYVHNIKSQVL